MGNRAEEIVKVCQRKGLEVVSLTYDRSISYETGGWDLEAKDEDGERYQYGGHSASDVIHDLERCWEDLKARASKEGKE